MDFFDKIGKTVTEAGQKTIAKTKEIADTSRLNTMISEQEKIINDLYYQIGRRYVSLHRDDCEDAFSAMIANVVDAEGKIQDYKKQIQVIKRVQRCPKCGAEMPSEASFCGVCGTVIPKIQVNEPSDYVRCEKCGNEVKRGVRFCAFCGNPMEAATAPAAKEPAAEPAYVKCEKCGNEVKRGVRFCAFCGNPMAAAPAVKEPEAEPAGEVVRPE